MTPIGDQFLAEIGKSFRKQKALAERAMAQLDDAQLFATIDPEANSVAIIVRHLYGNMRSRWTDFLTSDGEKPDRRRDEEFIAPASHDRAAVLHWWEQGWSFLFSALDALTPDDLGRTVHIRGDALTALSAILRQHDHYAMHVGQIVFLAKHLRGRDWSTLSIPRGKSEEYLQRRR
jgi:hypothetical protein